MSLFFRVITLLFMLNLLVGGEANGREITPSKLKRAQSLFNQNIVEYEYKIKNLLVQQLREKPKSIEAYELLSRLYIRRVQAGREGVARLFQVAQFADQIQTLSPERPLGKYLKCEVYYLLNQPDEASKLCTEAEVQFPYHQDTKIYKIRRWTEKDPLKTLDLIQEVLFQGVSIEPLIFPIITVLEKSSSPGKVGIAFRDFAKVFPHSLLWYQSGIWFLKEGMYQDAKESLEISYNLGNEWDSRIQLIVLLHEQLKDHSRAKSILKKLKKDWEQSELDNENVYSFINFYAIKILIDEQKHKEALKTLKSAPIEALSENQFKILNEGFSNSSAKELWIDYLKKLVHLNPLNMNYHIILTNSLVKGERWEEASSYYELALQVFPDQDSFWAMKGYAYYKLQKYKEAAMSYRRAISIQGDNGVYYYNLSCMLAKMGEYENSLKELKKAASFNPTLAQEAMKDEDFSSVRSHPFFHKKMGELQDKIEKSKEVTER